LDQRIHISHIPLNVPLDMLIRGKVCIRVCLRYPVCQWLDIHIRDTVMAQKTSVCLGYT
jgi:hypothetical protein